MRSVYCECDVSRELDVDIVCPKCGCIREEPNCIREDETRVQLADPEVLDASGD